MVTMSKDCFCVSSKVDQELMLLPTNDLFLFMDLSGKMYLEPVVFVLSSAKTLYLAKGSSFLFLKLPNTLVVNSFIEVKKGEYALNDDWALAVYGEMLDELHANKRLDGDNIGSVLNWANYCARKEYTDKLQGYVLKLQAHIYQKRIDSRSKRREFQKTFGRSPQEVKLIDRFSRSLEQLVHSGQIPISEFSDQAHWIRECKKYTGLTPSEINKLYIVF